MNPLIQRLLTETSPFFKKVQIAIGAILLICFSLKAYIPAPLLADILKYGITGIILSEFTVKDGSILAKDGFTIQAALEMVQAIPGQIDEVKQALAGKLSLDQAKTISGLPVAAPVAGSPADNTPASEAVTA